MTQADPAPRPTSHPTGAAPDHEDDVRRLDAVALIVGLLFLGFAGLALVGRSLQVSASLVVPAALAGLAVWLVASALTGRDRRAA